MERVSFPMLASCISYGKNSQLGGVDFALTQSFAWLEGNNKLSKMMKISVDMIFLNISSSTAFSHAFLYY